MFKFIINIGLNTNASESIAADVARQIVVANEFIIGDWFVAQSDTEPTLVAEVTSLCSSPAGTSLNLRHISDELSQDCIAVYSLATSAGALVGANAKAWGEFSPEYFIGMDGQRLAQAASA